MEKTFDSLATYTHLAKKIISKLGTKFYPGLSKEMLSNEDAIADVATALMYADWRYDENRTGASGEKKTLYSYRNQCALWAIKTYVTQKTKKKKISSIDYSNDDFDHSSMSMNIPDHKTQNPLEFLIEQEETNIVNNSMEEILNSNILNDKQRDQIKMYFYEDKTLSEIGQRFGVSREAVRQNIKRGINNIRKLEKVSV